MKTSGTLRENLICVGRRFNVVYLDRESAFPTNKTICLRGSKIRKCSKKKETATPYFAAQESTHKTMEGSHIAVKAQSRKKYDFLLVPVSF